MAGSHKREQVKGAKRRPEVDEAVIRSAQTRFTQGKTLSSISRSLGPPRTTLYDRISGSARSVKERAMDQQLLTVGEELQLVNYAFDRARQGIPLTKLEVIASANHLLQKSGSD